MGSQTQALTDVDAWFIHATEASNQAALLLTYMPLWQDRAFVQLPGLHPPIQLVFVRHSIAACFRLLSCNNILYVSVERCKDMDELVTQELALIQETVHY